MIKLYKVRVLSNNTTVVGFDSDNCPYLLDGVVYFNPNTGLLDTTLQQYLIVSYVEGKEYLVNEILQNRLNEVWNEVLI